MPQLPFPITATEIQGLVKQTSDLLDEMYAERIGGAIVGDVFYIGDDDILSLYVSDSGGLTKEANELSILNAPTGGLTSTSNGEAIKLKAGGGLTTTADGLSIFSEGYNFRTIACPAGTNPAADQVGDTLTLSAGTGITITGDASVDSITITAHAQQHAITSTSDHTSTATAAQMLKADASGLPVDSSITDAEGLSAVKANKGHRDGLNVTIADATNLYVSGGSIDIAGVVYTVDEELTVALGTIVAETLYYIYADAPASGRTLAAGDFTISDTAPVFNHTYGALYKTGDATKRYIGRYFEE
jgi:hypothetical protein